MRAVKKEEKQPCYLNRLALLPAVDVKYIYIRNPQESKQENKRNLITIKRH